MYSESHRTDLYPIDVRDRPYADLYYHTLTDEDRADVRAFLQWLADRRVVGVGLPVAMPPRGRHPVVRALRIVRGGLGLLVLLAQYV